MVNRDRDDPSDFRPWRLRDSGRVDARRRDLFAMAAPVFDEMDTAGRRSRPSPTRAGSAPRALYHYFSSKEDLATYIVRRPRMDWDSVWVDPTSDPLVQLRQLLDLSLAELPNFLLALLLEDEIAGSGRVDGAHARSFREGESVYGRLIAESAQGMSRAEATRVARDALSAMVGSAVLGLDPEPDAAIRPRVVAVLRAVLVPAHVEAQRFDAAMEPAEQTA